MGWIDVLTDTVKGLRATGKKEREIEEIITTAADKATVGSQRKEVNHKRIWIDGMFYEVAAPTRDEARTESNNWRKMHGLPMRRKGGKRHGRTGSSHRH